jgi:hypothetical protein
MLDAEAGYSPCPDRMQHVHSTAFSTAPSIVGEWNQRSESRRGAQIPACQSVIEPHPYPSRPVTRSDLVVQLIRVNHSVQWRDGSQHEWATTETTLP